VQIKTDLAENKDTLLPRTGKIDYFAVSPCKIFACGMHMSEATWGMRFNEYPNYQRVGKGQKPEGCPEWLEAHQIQKWQEQGLIIWNNVDRKLETLNGTETLKLISEVILQDDWKSNGVSVTHLVHRFELNLPSHKKRKKGEPEPEIEKPKGEDVQEEIMHLPPEAGYKLIELLESKKQLITQMAEQEKKRAQEVFRQFWDFLFELSHQEELKKFDFKTKSFEWQHDGDTRITCRYQTAEGRIWLAEDKLFWNTCVKREGHVGNSHRFIKFVEAVDWVEKEIVNLANKPDVKKEEGILCEEEIKANRIRLKAKFINGPYWIDATQIDPQRITYKVLIDLETKPISCKSFESICGDTYKIADRYPTPGKLANCVNRSIRTP